MYMIRHEMPFYNLAFLLPCSGVEDRSQLPPRLPKKWLSVFAWARTPQATCSPIWNGLGSDKAFNILLIVGHQATLRRSILPERSNLFQSHWWNQWLTPCSYNRAQMEAGVKLVNRLIRSR